MITRVSTGQQKRCPKWFVFCVGAEKDNQQSYFESLNIQRDYSIEVVFVSYPIPVAGIIGDELPATIFKFLNGKSYLGYTVFCDCNDFRRDFTHLQKASEEEARNFDSAIRELDMHSNLPVFWSNHSFEVWSTPRRNDKKRNKITQLKQEVAYAKSYYNQDAIQKIQEFLARGRNTPSSVAIAGYSNGGKHIIAAYDSKFSALKR